MESIDLKGGIFWYPHSAHDLAFIPDILVAKSIAPSLIIMNDIFNAQLDDAEIPGWRVERDENFHLEVSKKELKNESIVSYNISEENTDKNIRLLFLSGVDSDDLLRYFVECSLPIEYVFTSRGGLSYELLSQLKKNVFISDFHGIGNENIDGESSLSDLTDYTERLGFQVSDYIYNYGICGNVLICDCR